MLVGLVAGALSGSLGVGCGIVVVPALVLLLACPQKSAQGMALALMVPMAALGVFQYARTPGVVLQWGAIALLVAGAAAGVLAGARLMARLPEAWLQRVFAVFLLVVAIRMLWPASVKNPVPGPRGQDVARRAGD
ncbi:MAG: sulfite exporter TauE/SafE family protein [bacterium]